MTTETTALTVQARAAVALGSSVAETQLIELAGKSKAITAITNADGRKECHTAAMTAKEARINVEKAGKAAREDATLFSKAVIAEEKRLVDLIEPEEKRLIGIRDEYDTKVEAEKAAKAEAERQRVAAIREKIELIRRGVSNAAMLDAAGARLVLDMTGEIEIDDSYGEFFGDACEAKSETVAKLIDLVAAKTAAEVEALRVKAEQEAEALRIAAEREELARLRAEQDARTAAAAKEIADEAAHQKALRDAEEARLANLRRIEEERIQAQRDELAKQQKALDDQRQKQARDQAESAMPVPAVTPALTAPVGNVQPMIGDILPITNAAPPLRAEIDSALDQMDERELAMVLHYIGRIHAQRVAA